VTKTLVSYSILTIPLRNEQVYTTKPFFRFFFNPHRIQALSGDKPFSNQNINSQPPFPRFLSASQSKILICKAKMRFLLVAATLVAIATAATISPGKPGGPGDPRIPGIDKRIPKCARHCLEQGQKDSSCK
jgi:hypothetical protein